jgi:hypothetical protein
MMATGAVGAAAAIRGVTVWDAACHWRCRDVKQAYTNMSAKEKETLKWWMVEIGKAGAGNKENMQPSFIPM